MAAVMIVYVGGQQVSRCDERCYNAEGPACCCCCGGANHGVGLDQAVVNSQVMGRRYAEQYAAEQGHALTDSRLELPMPEGASVQLREI